MVRILDRLSDAHRSFFGDDAVETAIVHRKFLCDEGVGTCGVLRRIRRTVRCRNGVEVIGGQEVRCVCGRNKAPQVQAVGTAVLRESTVRNSLLQLNGVVNVGVLVDVTLGARPFDGQSPLRGDLVEGLLGALVVVLAVQVVVTVTLAHVLDAVVASGAGFGQVLVALRAIGRIDRVRLVGCTDEDLLAGRGVPHPLGRTVVDSLVHHGVAQVLDAGSRKCSFRCILTVNANVRAASARAGDASGLHVRAALAIHDRRGQGIESLVIDEGEGLARVAGDEAGQLQVQ